MPGTVTKTHDEPKTRRLESLHEPTYCKFMNNKLCVLPITADVHPDVNIP